MKIFKKIKSITFKMFIKVKERKYADRLKYLYFNNNSKDLIIVFSGFPSDDRPHYNYVKTLLNLKSKDKLFILDDFGIKGSYYWFEDGTKRPMNLVIGLLDTFVKKYDNIYTIGSSKGGSAAIYYGLLYNVKEVFAGANQYFIGNYLNTPERRYILEAMMGDANFEITNHMMPEIIEKKAGSTTKIHLLYSKDEHTYNDHIKWMIEDFNKNNIKYDEQLESFTDHGDVGLYFIPFVKHYFNIV